MRIEVSPQFLWFQSFAAAARLPEVQLPEGGRLLLNVINTFEDAAGCVALHYFAPGEYRSQRHVRWDFDEMGPTPALPHFRVFVRYMSAKGHDEPTKDGVHSAYFDDIQRAAPTLISDAVLWLLHGTFPQCTKETPVVPANQAVMAAQGLEYDTIQAQTLMEALWPVVQQPPAGQH